MAPVMEHLLEAQARGHRVASLEERPSLPADARCALQAARDLAADRTPAGFPFVAVAAWARATGIDPFWLADALRAIDEATASTGDDNGGSADGQREGRGTDPA